MSFFGNLFGKKKRTLSDLSVDDLKREQITLQQEQRKLDAELEKGLKDERQLKSEYVQADSPTQKKIVARKIQNARMMMKAGETKSSHCYKMLQTVNNFMLIKDNMQFFEKMGVASMLANMDMAEIDTFISEATVEGALQQEKLASMLQQVTDGVEQITEATGEASLDDLMAELDGEIEEQGVAGAVQTESGLSDIMGELDNAIAKGEQAAKEAKQSASPQRETERPRGETS